jgi:hypothetical protein
LWQLSWVSRRHWFRKSVFRADSGSERVTASWGVAMNGVSIDHWSLKNILRSCVVLLAGIIAGGRAVSAVQSLQQYHAIATTEPSRAEPYLTVAAHDLGILALSFALAGLVWWLLRPSSASGTTKRN